MEDVDVEHRGEVSKNGQRMYEVGFRVRESTLQASEQQNALQATSLLEEANKEMSQSQPVAPASQGATHASEPPKKTSASPPQKLSTLAHEPLAKQDSAAFFSRWVYHSLLMMCIHA